MRLGLNKKRKKSLITEDYRRKRESKSFLNHSNWIQKQKNTEKERFATSDSSENEYTNLVQGMF